MALGMGVGLGPGHIVLDGEPAPLPQKGTEHPIFGPFYCRQTVGWIKMALGMEVGLSPGDFVLDGDPGQSPKFSANVRCGQTTGWTEMALGMEVGLGPATLCSMGTQLPPEQRAHPLPPSFWPMFIVAKRLDE